MGAGLDARACAFFEPAVKEASNRLAIGRDWQPETIARNAVSLGGVESLACRPLTTTHSELSADELAEAGINESMVRVSVRTEPGATCSKTSSKP